MKFPCLLLLPILSLPALAETARPEPVPASGNVVISVQRFEELLEAARKRPEPPPEPEPEPPLAASVESVHLDVTVGDEHATVAVVLVVRVLADEWVTVPLLPLDTAIDRLTVDGLRADAPQAAERAGAAVGQADGRHVLHLLGRGERRVELRHGADVERLVGGYRLVLPSPVAATGRLTASLPGTGWQADVLPGAGLEVSTSGGRTLLAAALPRTDRLQVLWGTRGASRHVFTRASHAIDVIGEGAFVRAEYLIEIDSDVPRDVPLVSAGYALQRVDVDGAPGRVVRAGDQHAVTLQGHGVRRVDVDFAVNVDRGAGQPAVDLDVPVVPISRFVLELPGKRQVDVDPPVPLAIEADDSSTRVEAHLPSASHVRFSWTDSRPVPEQNVRTNAEGYYAVTAERGGLRVAARFEFNVISGKAATFLFRVPDSVVIYEVTGDGVADWRTSRDEESGLRTLSVYLDEPRHGPYVLHVAHDSLLRKTDPIRTSGVAVPLLVPEPVHRFRGVLLLLAGEELEFQPLDADGLSSIGEEALPPDVRSSLSSKVAHGFKFVGEAPEVRVRLQEPRKEEAKLDVLMSSLVTFDEGALQGQVSVDVVVKSGSFKELVFVLDPSTTVLDVVAPALLKFEDALAGGRRLVTATFTEEMSGTVRMGLAVERILDPAVDRLALPPIEVRGADVQRGHVALASASAVEVEGIPGESIHPIGIDELPRSLVAATTNPLLLAYEYWHLPYELEVAITQHEAVQPVEARVSAASLVTELEAQGNLVTRAEYVVTNRSRQFLRVELPEGAELWSVVVDGRSVRAARDERGRVIVPLPRTESPIRVALEHAERHGPLGLVGRAELTAPRPDLFVSGLAWSIRLPDGRVYGAPRTNLRVVDRPSGHRNRLELRRDLVDPQEEPPRVALRHRRVFGGRGLDLLTGALGVALAGLLLRAGRSPSRLERGVTVALAALALAAVIALGASAVALVAPLLSLGTTGYLVASRRRAAAA